MTDLAKPTVTNPASYVPVTALAFGARGSEAAFVDHRAPLPVRGGAAEMSLIERLNREGEEYAPAIETALSTFTPNPATPPGLHVGSFQTVPGKAWYIQSVTISCTTPIRGRMQLGNTSHSGAVLPGTIPMMDIQYTCGPNYPAVIPVNAFLRSIRREYAYNLVSRFHDPDVSGTHHIHIGYTGWLIADSLNFEAEKTLIFFGDSLWNGTGPSDFRTCVPWAVNNHYRAKGIDSRYILKAISGAQTLTMDTLRKGGDFDYPRADAIFYQLGANDASGGVTTNDSLGRVAAFIAWARLRWPKVKIVVLGPPPLENNTHEAALAALRAAISGHIGGLNDPATLFCDLGAAFDRTSAANYAGSDTPGSRVHPDDDGFGAILNGGYNGFGGLLAWLDANLPAV